MLSLYRSFLLITLILTVTFLGTTQAQYLNKSKYPAQSILNNTNVFENNFISSISKSKILYTILKV